MLEATPLALCRAAESGDLRTVREILAADPGLCSLPHPDHSRRRRNYMEPMFFAAREGHEGVVRVLLEAGANPIGNFFHNVPQPCPLSLARTRGHYRAVGAIEDHLRRQLDALPASIHALRGEQGNTLLHMAVYHRHWPLVVEALDRGAAVDAVNDLGQRPIHLALYNGMGGSGPMLRAPYWEIAGILLGRGARNDIWVASAMGDAAAVRRLLEGDEGLANWNSGARRYPGGANYPLGVAALEGRLEVAGLLLDYGADPDLENDNEYREDDRLESGVPLVFAIARGHLKVAYRLISRGARVDRSLIHSGPGIMDVALQSGNRELIDRIAMEGGKPLLEHYCRTGNYLLIRELLDRCPHEPGREGGETVLKELLLSGVREGDPKIVSMCLKLEPVLGDGLGPWACGSLGLLYHIIRKAYGTRRFDPVLLEALLAYGLNVDDRDSDGIRALHSLSDPRHGPRPSEEALVAIARVLVGHGADINAMEERTKATPLGWAVRYGRYRVAEFLLSRGADPNLSGGPDNSPLSWAVRNGYQDLRLLLVNRGAR